MNKAAVALLQKHFDLALDAPNGIKKLRELILTLAMQGKLVPQDPKDQPASELLEEIEAEKRRLVKEGKIKAPKPLTEIKPEEVPYAVPAGWEWVRLGKITINRDSERIPVSKDERQSMQGEYDYYGASGVIDKVSKYLFDKSLLLIGEDGANLLSHSTPIAFIAKGKYWVNNHAHVIDATKSELLVYLENYFAAITLEKYVTGTAQPKMNQEKMNSIPISLPPLAEQKRIVAKVDQLMARCDALEELRDRRQQMRLDIHSAAIHQILDPSPAFSLGSAPRFSVKSILFSRFNELYGVKENVAELRKAILQLAVMGRLVPQDPKDQPASELLKEIEAEKKRLVKEGKIKVPKTLPEIKPEDVPYALPAGWEWVRLGELIELISGQHLSPNEYNESRNGFSYYTGPADFGERFPIPARWTTVDRSIAIKGDVLLTVKGAGVGKTNVLNEPMAAISRQLMALRVIGISDDFLLRYLATKFKELQALATGIAIPGIGRDDVLFQWFPLPPLAEQNRIVAKIDQLMALCDSLEQGIDAATKKQTQVLQSIIAGVA